MPSTILVLLGDKKVFDSIISSPILIPYKLRQIFAKSRKVKAVANKFFVLGKSAKMRKLVANASSKMVLFVRLIDWESLFSFSFADKGLARKEQLPEDSPPYFR